VATKAPYTRPYFDSSVFISWLKDTDVGPLPDGSHGDRHPISAFVVKQAENRLYPMYTSYLTMAEVFKKKGDGKQSLTDTENGRIMQYFQNDWIEWIPVERLIGEDANALLVQHRAERLMPCDAVHLACALRAKCDVLLAWDGPLRKIKRSDIRIEYPDTFAIPVIPKPVPLGFDE
jgi:predicted nucleic acid-binding protein